MTTFNYEWDATFEANPEDTDYFHFGALEIRDLKKAFRERFNVDHYMPLDGGEDQGEHRKLTIRVNDEYAPADSKPALYVKNVSEKPELFYVDSSENEIQLTGGGALKEPFPSGTKMLFYQDTAPLGWTIQVLDDKMAFVTKGSAAGGETGGGAHSTGTWTQPDHSHTTEHRHNSEGDEAGFMPHSGWGAENAAIAGYLTVGYTGGLNPRASKDRPFTMAIKSAINSGGGATSPTWRPASYCFIIASKD